MTNNLLPVLTEGISHHDPRGSLISYNDFDMRDVKRLYTIHPSSTEIVRAWQAHQYEEKWFVCLDGAFEVKVVKIDNFMEPSVDLPIYNFLLEAKRPQVLHIPGGYANGFKAISENSRLLVYSNFTVAESTSDDYRYPTDKWNLW